MRIRLVSLEDGITACGFRKFAATACRLNEDTESFYISTTRSYRGIKNVIRGTHGGKGVLADEYVDEIARGLAGADLIGFSSMTGYADLTRRVIHRIRELDPKAMLVWGGIHPIIHPEDAIQADVDAICTGEGEVAFRELYQRLQSGSDFSTIGNFWFKQGDKITRNGFLPLMSSEELENLPFPQYGEREKIYRPGEGFTTMGLGDYLANDGLAYRAVWSIGCPFHCTFCGNTKFIANDVTYKKIRHPSARYCVEEVKSVRRRFPHVSEITFFDDSFMAIPYREIEKFAELWKAELNIPFSVYGVIPNYVERKKFEVLTWAGMNRIRMGIQSGSQRILDFYKRPTPPLKVLAAGEVCASFAPRHHIPPFYDIITDNPIETREDVIDTLELLYKMARPYTLAIYSLKVIPNTELERAMKELGVDIEEISESYAFIPPRVANLMLYLLALWRPPRWLFDRLLTRVQASSTAQPLYPKLGLALRTLYLLKRVVNDLRFLDFSVIPGWSGYVLWRLGVIDFSLKRRKLPPPPGGGGSSLAPIVPQGAAGAVPSPLS